MNLLNDFGRVNANRPCPVCGKPDWCLVARDEPPSQAICQRVASSRPWGDAGYLHRLREHGREPARVIRVASIPAYADLSGVADLYLRAVEPAALERHAAGLGVTTASLLRLRIGRAGTPWSFPMTGPDGRVCGIRLRTEDARKWSVRGGREGLFVPEVLDARAGIAIAEGPTDTAAVLDLGFEAVGRPSCSGGTRLLVTLVKRLRPPSLVIFADADGPGQRGAKALALVLATYCRDVRTVTPPAKDARAWLIAGATADDACVLVESATPHRLVIQVKRRLP